MEEKKYTNYKDLEEVLKVVEKLNPDTDFNIKLLKSYDNAKYFNSTFKIDGEFKTLQFDVNKVNMKLKPQTQTKDGKWTKVKASFMIDKDSTLGKIFMILSEKVETVLTKTFKGKKVYTIVQKEITKTDENGIDNIKQIENPIGWICLKNQMKPYDKRKFSSSVIVINNTDTGSTKKTLKNPTFEELHKKWDKRALVSGSLTIESFNLLAEKVLFTITFTNKPLVILPIPSTTSEDPEMVNDMMNHAVSNSIYTVSDIETEKCEKGENEPVNDFDTV
jgi:hypothetical protein